MKHLYRQTRDISSISHSEQGQTKLHCHQVMRLSCDAVFAKVKDRHGDDDNCCGRQHIIYQFGDSLSGVVHQQAPYSDVLVQVVLVWKRHFQILITDLCGAMCKPPLSRCSLLLVM